MPLEAESYVNFTRGFVPDSNPFAPVEGSLKDISNLEIQDNGRVDRREGLDYEDLYQRQQVQTTQTDMDELAISEHKWIAPNNQYGEFYDVIQIGDRIYIYDTSRNNANSNISGGYLAEISLVPYQSGTGSASLNKIDTASLSGELVIVSSALRPIKLSYNGTSFVVSLISITIRDFDGLDDSLDNDDQPSTLSDEHHYNLRNNGWPNLSRINEFNTNIGVYPSKANVYNAGKYTIVSGALAGLENWSASNVDNFWVGNSRPTNGHFKLDYFTRDRETASGIAGIPDEVLSSRFTTVTPYFGRVAYSGARNEVVISKLIREDDDYGEAYQEADPTAEIANDLVATDGVVIKIPEASQVRKIRELGSNLIVFSDNGVWIIGGQGEDVFKATAFAVWKLTDIGCRSPDSVVITESSVYFWGESGIYKIGIDQVSLKPTIENITDNGPDNTPRLTSFFFSIEESEKDKVKGIYDFVNHKIRYLFNSLSTTGGFTEELIYDIRYDRFEKNSFGSLASNAPKIYGYLPTPLLIEATQTNTIINSVSNTLINTLGNTLVVTRDISEGLTDKINFVYLTAVQRSGESKAFITMAYLKNTGFNDWITEDTVGVDPGVYGEVWSKFGQSPLLKKSKMRVVSLFERTEDGYDVNGDFTNPSSCLMQVRWDFADSTGSNKFSDETQIYKLHQVYIPEDTGDPFDYGFEIIKSITHLTGTGNFFRFRFSGEEGKNLKFYGWLATFDAQ